MQYVGVMSGTSCDGIDVALVDFDQPGTASMVVVASEFFPYPESIKAALADVMAGVALPIASIADLDAKLGHLYSQAINDLIRKNQLDKHHIQAIGLHGQTVFHQPPENKLALMANTLQIGSAAIVAAETGITTVANFRQMDVASGGQGAPLAPVLHRRLFAQQGEAVAVLNLGGIANITVIDGNITIGFDTGPANCLMDEWIKQHKGQAYDANGQWASQGNVHKALLKNMLAEPYFSAKYPKSTGRELFNAEWLASHLAPFKIAAVDVQRTLLQLTVETVLRGCNQVDSDLNRLIVCGGGASNDLMMQLFSQSLPIPVSSSAEFGVDPDYVEAVLMAWLAKQNIEHKRLDLADITNAQEDLIYGVQYVV